MSRKMTVAAVGMARGLRKAASRQDNFRYLARCLDEIAPLKPDLVCLPEVFPISDLGLRGSCDPADIAFLCDSAKRHRANLIGSLYERRGGVVFNTALMAGRDGTIIGRYDKVHPTEPEIEAGIRPGAADQPLIQADFGRVGVQICFDANWTDDWARLARRGAEIIIFPSAYPAGRVLEAISLLNHVFIVAAVQQTPSGILDNTGRWLAQTDRLSWWVSARIDLERTVFHWDFQGDRLRDIRARYADRIRIETFGHEAWFVLEPADETVSIPEVAKEFGLVTHCDYLRRAEAARRKALSQA